MWEYLKKADKPIVLYGMGNGADKILDTLTNIGVSVSGVFASDDFVRYQNYRGFTVKKYSDFVDEFGSFIVLVCFGTFRDDVLNNIKKIASEQELFAPDVAVYGGGLFDREYVAENKSRLEDVYFHLADEQSKFVFENCINYRLSGKIDFLLECETSENEAFNNILKLNSNEAYLDLGAYNGDTVEQFIKNVEGYDKIVAVEPDKRNFKKLQKNTENLDNITLINKCVSFSSSSAKFDMNGGRNSVISQNGKPIETICIDDIDVKRISYIKMDVEGAEIDAIKGGKNTILLNKPKMLISAYHKTDDYLTIPETVLGFRDDYKIYMRHYKYIPAWDTQFYFV